MDLKEFLIQRFPEGLTYRDSAQLCLHLYCTVDNIPENLHTQCTKDNLAIVFSGLAKSSFIKTEPLEASHYGANFHNVTNKEHWIEIIASIFKSENTSDTSISKEAVLCLTKQ